MKKLKQKSGLSLVEMLAAILILVLLSVGIVTCMNSSTRSYNNIMFDSDCASLSYNLNNALGDILRYSTDAENTPSGYSDAEVTEPNALMVFKNREYCRSYPKAYFHVETESYATTVGKLKVINLYDRNRMFDPVNEGAYGKTLGISDFSCTYHPAEEGQASSYFDIEYTIHSLANTDLTRTVTYCVQQLNQ